jgi:hypothetical protein
MLIALRSPEGAGMRKRGQDRTWQLAEPVIFRAFRIFSAPLLSTLSGSGR